MSCRLYFSVPCAISLLERRIRALKLDGRQVKAFEAIDKAVRGEMESSPGRIVPAMILDALSGRSPLFRLQEFYQNKDTELLLGDALDPACLRDWTIGRVLERLYDYGTNKILTSISVRACRMAMLQNSYFHFDTTSIRV